MSRRRPLIAPTDRRGHRARRPSRTRTLLGRALLPAAAVAGLTLLAAYAVIGPNGLLALGDYKRQIAARETHFAQLDKQRAVLRNRVALLDPRHANPDMVDELVRKELNVAHPNEVVITLDR